MKKFALTAMAVALAAPASANHLEHFFEGMEFRNKGQCQAALMAERNDRRNNDGNTGSFTTPEYNEAVRNFYQCIQVDKNTWIVVRT